ncbi:MAG: PIN domain-containing protein [Thermodesulfobacteriota bacterium]
MPVLVDTSVWVDYFRSGEGLEHLDVLLDENLVVTNKLILAELIPFLRMRNQKRIIELLRSINLLRLEIDWEEISEFQYKCLKAGINGVGIPDLIIAQNALRHRCLVFSRDNHFQLLRDVLRLEIVDVKSLPQ